MKNSASIPRVVQEARKQALRVRAQQILPALTALFSDLHYSEILHQRLSQQSNNNENDYQGLTRAQHSQFGKVIIKWQLSGLIHDASQSSVKLTGLIQEATVLKSINSLSNNQNSLQNSLSAITPPILAYENLTVQILSQPLQLKILVMPYYPNGSLATQLSAENHLLLADRIKYHFIVQSAHLIANLHNAGWLHNDIKPSNILIEGFLPSNADDSSIIPNLLLTDFALAEPITKSIEASLAGTPAYLAPERWQGQGATMQSDIYAFGIMMTEILVGARPFKIHNQSSEPLREWAVQHCQQLIPTLPLEYSRYQGIVDKVLAKRVQKRYQNMDEVLKDLESLESLRIDKAYY